MGMELIVLLPAQTEPSWSACSALLMKHRYPMQMRMIDGQLAFPDEEPTETWRELRVANSAGMITIRREPTRLLLVTWGNADPALQQAWHVLTWAWAECTSGRVQAPTGIFAPSDFLAQVSLPPEFQATAE